MDFEFERFDPNFSPLHVFFLSPHIYILIQHKRDRCTSDISDINTTCKTRRHTHTHIHTCEKSGWRRGRFGRERFKDRLIRERARNRYRGGAAAPNLRDFFQNYEAARNPRDTSPLIKRIAGLGGWFKFCTCPTVTRGGKKKRRKREFLPFFSPPSPPFFPSPMQGRDSFPLPRVAPFLSRGQRDRSEIPPFKRPIPTSGYQRRNEARAFFLPRFARRSQKLVNHTETASWEICSDTLGQLKYPKVGEKLAHSPCPPPCGGSDAQQFLQQALINLIRRPWQICGGKKIGEHVLLLSRFIHSSIRSFGLPFFGMDGPIVSLTILRIINAARI